MFLGYIPDQTTSSAPVLPPIYGKTLYDSTLIHNNAGQLETPNQIQPNIHPDLGLRDAPIAHRRNDQYQSHNIDNFEGW